MANVPRDVSLNHSGVPGGPGGALADVGDPQLVRVGAAERVPDYARGDISPAGGRLVAEVESDYSSERVAAYAGGAV